MRAFWRRAPRPIRDLALAPPAPEPGRHGLALVAILRDEEAHLAEWARFHLAGGVRHVVAYDNGSLDRGPAVLREAVGADRLTLVPWRLAGSDLASGRPLHPQMLAYAHALRTFGGAFARIAFLDIDEFLVPVGAASIEEALAATEGHPNVSLPWVHFGFGGHATPPASVIDGFRDRAKSLATGLNFKMILDPCEVTALSVHHARTRSRGEETVNDQGRPAGYRGRKAPGFLSCERLQLNHYFTRSRAEFEAKLARGSAAAKTAAAYAASARAKAEAISRDTRRCDRAADFARAKGLLP